MIEGPFDIKDVRHLGCVALAVWLIWAGLVFAAVLAIVVVLWRFVLGG